MRVMNKKMRDLSKLTPEELDEFRNRYDAYFFDMDGCLVELGGGSLEGVEEAVSEIVKQGKSVKVLTDNCLKTLEDISFQINKLFPAVKKDDVMNTTRLLGKYLQEIMFNKKIYVLGSETGIVKELKDFGFDVLHDEELRKITIADVKKIKLDEGVGAVVVAGDINFNYSKLMKASNYLADPDVLLFQTHYPSVGAVNPIFPAAGSLVAALKATTGRTESICTGKGSEYSIKYLRSFGYEMERCLFVGDGIENDIHFGNLCGMDTLLVLSGACNLKDVQKAKEKNLDTYIPTYYTNSVADLMHIFKPKS